MSTYSSVIVNGKFINCPSISETKHMRRADSVNGGVPATVDIMNPSVNLYQMVDSSPFQHLASLILSSPSENGMANGALVTNETKATLNSNASPFILCDLHMHHSHIILLGSFILTGLCMYV